MRRFFVTLVVLLIICSTAIAADYVGVDFNHGDDWIDGTYHTMQFRFTYECPDPATLPGTSNGFLFTTTGDATFDHIDNDFSCHGCEDAWWLCMFPYDCANESIVGEPSSVGSGLTIGKVLTGGACGIPSGELVDYLFFDFGVTVHGQDGQFCIDSSNVGSTGPWRFSGMTCGFGGAPDRPLFVDASGSDDNHPICVNLAENPCVGPTITTVPDNDSLYGFHCEGFQFEADPGMFPPDPSTIVSWSVIDGPGSIDENGYYSIRTYDFIDYDVTIEVVNACYKTATYTFHVQWYNHLPSFVECPMERTALTGSQAAFQLSATDPDTCDVLGYYVSYNGGQTGVSVSNDGLFTWDPTPSETGTYTFIVGTTDFLAADECSLFVTLADGSTIACGDIDATGQIDIDDIVYLISFVFQGGPEPILYSSGDVDCSGGIDIDDVVYLIAYVFQGGNAPCDPDGDSVPDC